MAAITNIFKKSSVLKNFSVLTFANVFSQALSILTSIKIARSIQPAVYGTYNLLQLQVAICVIIGAFGLKNIVVRTIARDKANSRRVFMAAFVIRAVGLIIAFISCFIYAYFYSGIFNNFLFLLTLICIASLSFYDLLEGVAFGLERMEYSGMITFINSGILWTVVILLLPGHYFNLKVLFAAYVGLNVANILFYIFFIYKKKCLTGNFAPAELKGDIIMLLKESFPYLYLSFLTVISNQLPMFFLQKNSGVAEVAYFNLANKILSPMTLILNTALAALFPNLSNLFVSNYDTFVKRSRNIFVVMSLMGIMGAFGVNFFLKEIFLLMYGQKYVNACLVLGYQCWYMALYALVCLIGTLFGVINRQRELGYLAIVTSIIQVPILWIGSKYGAQYLSAAFLVATAVSFLIHIVLINRFLKNGFSVMFFLKMFAIFAAAYFISSSVSSLNLFLKAIIFLAISAITAFAFFRHYKTAKA